MAQTIKLRRSATASAVPTTGQLALGELAINTFDGKLFLKKDNGTQSIVEVGAGGSASAAGSNTQIQFNNSGAFGASSDFTWDNTAKDLYVNGQVGIGAAAQANVHFQIGGTAQSGSNTSYVLWNAPTIPSTSTSGAFIFSTYPSTAAAAFTCASIVHFHAFQGTVGAGSTLSNQYGLYIDSSLTGATNNYGVYSAIASGTNRWNLYVAGTATNYLAGRLNLGSTSTSIAAQFYFGGTAPSGTDVYSVYTDQVIPATATSSASAVTSNLSTAASAFTLSSLNHFLATKGTFGAGSTVTTQRGFYAHNSLTGATNNYGFFSDIAAGTNRWNFYSNGTAYNFFQGAVGTGTGPLAYTQLRIGSTGPSSSNLTYSVYADQTAPATTTSEFASFYSIPNTAASAFTLGSLFHYIAVQGTVGAGSAITNQFGFYVGNNLTGATNNYGFYSNIPSGTNRWNFYANGTAANFLRGDVGVGVTPSARLDVYNNGGATPPAFVARIYSDSSTSADSNALLRFTGNNSVNTRSWDIGLGKDTDFWAHGHFGIYDVTAAQTRLIIGTLGEVAITGTGGGTNQAVQLNLDGSTPTGLGAPKGVGVFQTIASSATTSYHGFYSQPYTAAAVFTLPNLVNFYAGPVSLGAGSAVTNQYGFQSAIASGTGRWNFYASGTAANYFAGQVGIGVTPSTTTQLQVGNVAVGGATSATGVYISQTAPATMTASYTSIQSVPNTTASSFTLGSLYHFVASQGSIGAGSAITNQYGFVANSNMVGATNNYGFYSNIPASTGDWNFYAAGTAWNYFAGDTGVGIAPDGTQFLHVGAGTTTKAPIELNAGTNMTTVDAGSVEYDGTCLYFTPSSVRRSAVTVQQLCKTATTRTLTSQTGAQALFTNVTTNGAVSVSIGLHQFECFFSLSGMSATSGSFGFSLVAGTAVVFAQGWHAHAAKAALATPTNALITYNTAANTALATANTTTTGYALIRGTFLITTAGTIIPSVSLGVAAAATLGAHSYFMMSPIHPTNSSGLNAFVGDWT